MTKVLIVSDSHGLRTELVELRKRHGEEIDLWIHCGDSELSDRDKEVQNFSIVRGNCDFGSAFDDEVIEEAGGLRFFITHGHLHSVKSSLMKLLYCAEEVNAQIICFGHTHVLGAELVRNKLFINPGSLRLPRERKERTYVILHIKGKTVEFHVHDFDHGEKLDLRRTFEFADA